MAKLREAEEQLQDTLRRLGALTSEGGHLRRILEEHQTFAVVCTRVYLSISGRVYKCAQLSQLVCVCLCVCLCVYRSYVYIAGVCTANNHVYTNVHVYICVYIIIYTVILCIAGYM